MNSGLFVLREKKQHIKSKPNDIIQTRVSVHQAGNKSQMLCTYQKGAEPKSIFCAGPGWDGARGSGSCKLLSARHTGNHQDVILIEARADRGRQNESEKLLPTSQVDRRALPLLECQPGVGPAPWTAAANPELLFVPLLFALLGSGVKMEIYTLSTLGSAW